MPSSLKEGAREHRRSVALSDSAAMRPDAITVTSARCFHWTVTRYVRKVAFVHIPMSRKMRLARGVYQTLKGIARPRRQAARGTAALLKGS